MNLNKLATEIIEINTANGWNCTKPEQWEDTYKVPAILALIHTEVSEAVEAFRHNLPIVPGKEIQRHRISASRASRLKMPEIVEGEAGEVTREGHGSWFASEARSLDLDAKYLSG